MNSHQLGSSMLLSVSVARKNVLPLESSEASLYLFRACPGGFGCWPMQVGITPTHGNLDRVMKVGNAVVAPQEQSPPDHRANASQDDLELDYTAKRFPQFDGRTSTHFFMLSLMVAAAIGLFVTLGK